MSDSRPLSTADPSAVATAGVPVTPEKNFRPDIQALRAVAVLTVVVYHLWPARLPGGFIGVDVFFVISGYLITQHLVGEIRRTGHVALLAFWARRIRRLLPAAFLVLFSCLVLLAVFMPPVTWQLNLTGIRSSGAYVVNWQLGFDSIDYLAAENNPSMVLHYWSLAVEEQFYLFWPLLMIAGMAVGGRAATTAVRIRRIAWTLGSAFVVTFVASVVLTPRLPELAFYATPLRAWEFAAGGLLALAGQGLVERIRPDLRAALAWIGWVVIAAGSLLIVGADVQFPGWIALVPVLGAVCCLLAGDPDIRWSARPVVRHPAVQWLGDHSYSVYLWHWPLIVAAPWVLGGELTWPAKLALLAITLVLAWATKRWVEDSVRTSAWWRTGLRRSYGFAVIGAVVLVVVTTLWTKALDAGWVDRERAGVAAIEAGEPCFGAAASAAPDGRCPGSHVRPSPMDIAAAAGDVDPALNLCQQSDTGTAVVLCEFGSDDPDRTVAVIGNSHALRLVPALEQAAADENWKILLAAKTNCLGFVVPDLVTDPDCATWSDHLATELADRGDVDVAVFANHANADNYLAGVDASPAGLASAADGVLGTFDRYRRADIGVLVAGDVPGTRPDAAPTCVSAAASDVDPCAFPRAEVDVPTVVDRTALAHPELVSYVPTADFLCDEQRCHAVVGGIVAYSDAHHLTTTFSRSMGPFLATRIEEVLARSTG